jgi:hypothetical protein
MGDVIFQLRWRMRDVSACANARPMDVRDNGSPGLPGAVPFAVMSERLKKLSDDQLDALIEVLLPGEHETPQG